MNPLPLDYMLKIIVFFTIFVKKIHSLCFFDIKIIILLTTVKGIRTKDNKFILTSWFTCT